jgi:hypothetical protein
MLCSIALVIGILLPRDLLSGLPFGLLLFLAVSAILAILYSISAVISIITKIRSKVNNRKSNNN